MFQTFQEVSIPIWIAGPFLLILGVGAWKIVTRLWAAGSD
jgi:hypothetical protein